MKKFIAIFVAAAMLAATFTACSSSDDGQPDDSSSSSSSTTPEEQENEGDQSEDNSGNEGDNSGENNGGDSSDAESVTQQIANEIKAAYDPDSIPFIDMLPEELINDRYGLDPDSYTEITAQVPMISTFVDTVVVVKAADGKAGDVEAALNAYHNSLVEESIQYPMNVAKVNAGKVVANGDYVAFIMLGAIDDREDASDSERAEFAEQQTQIGVDAFNAYFD